MGIPSEEQLIRRTCDGEVEAFGELVRRHGRYVYVVLRRMTGSSPDADDLAQETFLRAYAKLKSFSGKSDFRTWLYRIAVNLCMDAARRARKRREGALGVETLIDSGDGPVEQAARVELSALIDASLGMLSSQQRAAIVLTTMQGLTHREAAEVCGCSEGTLSWRVFQGKQKLREMLKRHLEA